MTDSHAQPTTRGEDNVRISYATAVREAARNVQALSRLNAPHQGEADFRLRVVALTQLAALIERAEQLAAMEARQPWDGRPTRSTYAEFNRELTAGFPVPRLRNE